ncbi:serpin family protein [Nitrosopumilus sp.]|uniref:serpin family protein n=1 Tax=Nitrosopumilus sp. TaxID=2024843 RepID=UPI003D0C08A9
MLALGIFVILQNHAYATCAIDTDDPPVSCDGKIGILDYPKSPEQLIPSPLKQMTLGIKLGHVICDSEHHLAYNIRYEPACVFPDSESSLLTRGWAKLRLLLPAGPDPIKELELTGQNEMSYRINGNLVSGDDKPPLSDERIRDIAWEYSQKHHQDEQYLEYSISSVQHVYNVGDKIELNLLEWGNYSGCWDLKLRIIDVQNNPVYVDDSIKHCSETDEMSGTFHSYLTGKDFEEFTCPHPGYYRVEVSNGNVFYPQILQNFVCLDPEPGPKPDISHQEKPVNENLANNDDFVFSLYRQIIKDDDTSNFFFSPFSISTAFSMAYEGARGNTALQMKDAFGFSHDDKTRWSNMSDALKKLNHENGFYALEVANGMWLSELYEIKPEYVDVVTTHYNGTAKSVDFVSNEGVDEINQWVKEKTRGKIQDILEQGSTDKLTLLALTNSIYFNGEWSDKFSPDRTTQESFWIGNGESVNVQMMKIPSDTFNYAETDTAQILEMPYLGKYISMLVVLPKDKNGLSSLEASLDSSQLSEFRSMMEKQPLTVHIPKFGFESDYDLIPLLKELGIRDAFDKNNADFTGIIDDDTVYLSQAKHKAFVDVHEEGTEAAAVTVLIAQFSSGPPDPLHEFIADHPFVFVIPENSAEEILFIGRVTNPAL